MKQTSLSRQNARCSPTDHWNILTCRQRHRRSAIGSLQSRTIGAPLIYPGNAFKNVGHTVESMAAFVTSKAREQPKPAITHLTTLNGKIGRLLFQKA